MNFGIDIFIVSFYMLFCIGIGLYKYGAIKNIRDYTLGAKPFTTIVLLATTFATAISARQIIGNVGKIYQLGLIFIIPIFFVPMSWLILAKILAPNLQMFRKHNFISLSSIMEHWYGEMGRWITNVISLLIAVAVAATSAIAIGYLLHHFIDIPKNIGMIIGLVVVTSYSFFGGIVSVAFTDVFQFLIFFIALPTACIIGYRDIGGIENIWHSLPKDHIQISTEHIPLLLSFIFFALMPDTTIPNIQRALIAKDKRQFLQSFVSVAILLVPLLIIVCLIGLITYHTNPDLESSKVLYYFIDKYMPVGIKGFMIAGLLAVIMSTQDSYLNTTSALLAHDVCKQLWPSLTDKQELLIARISCVIIAAISVSVILVNKDIIEIIWLVDNFALPLVTVPLILALIGLSIDKKSFIFVVSSALTAVIATRFVTGAFDTRSLTIGMITSAIVIYILHKKNNKENFKPSFPKIRISYYFNKINARILSNPFSINSLYSIGIILGINAILGLMFADLSYLNILNSSFVIMAYLSLLLLLNERWHRDFRKYINPIWRFSLIFGLAFIPSYIMFSNDFHVFWLCNLALSIVLLTVMTDLIVATIFTLIATSVGYLLTQAFYFEGDLIAQEFAVISCATTLIAVIMQIYNHNFIAKTAHKEITYELENAMRKNTTKLKKAMNVKKEFLNRLNHEIRTPLHNMLGISDGIYGLWHTLSDEEKKQFIKNIIDNRDRLIDYTSNIFDLADLKQSRFNLNVKSQVNLIEIAKAAIDKASSLILKSNKNLNIKLEIKSPKPAMIECDEERISQVIYNLLYNAIQYSTHGVIKLFITATEDNIIISISDQGIKVPDTEKLEIFNPFFEGSRTKYPDEGKGLGLALAREIILLHNGNIKVEDNHPKGAIFTFTLPYKIRLEIKQDADV